MNTPADGRRAPLPGAAGEPGAAPAACDHSDGAAQDAAVERLLEAVYRHHGHDFRDYARATVKRRLRLMLDRVGLECLSDLTAKLLDEPTFLDEFLSTMSVPVTEMFRDPPFFLALRRLVIPILQTYPYVTVWHAGCATGQEVYSTAIVLEEEGFYDRARLYATDSNPRVLAVAREGIYDTEQIRLYTENYHRAGGKASFAEYYHARYRSAKMRADLGRNIVFAQHNLVTDQVFSEVNLVICRNVLIYFNRALQDRALSLFEKSLCHRGVLCLGTRESLGFSPLSHRFEPLSEDLRIFRKAAEA